MSKFAIFGGNFYLFEIDCFLLIKYYCGNCLLILLSGTIVCCTVIVQQFFCGTKYHVGITLSVCHALISFAGTLKIL